MPPMGRKTPLPVHPFVRQMQKAENFAMCRLVQSGCFIQRNDRFWFRLMCASYGRVVGLFDQIRYGLAIFASSTATHAHQVRSQPDLSNVVNDKIIEYVRHKSSVMFEKRAKSLELHFTVDWYEEIMA